MMNTNTPGRFNENHASDDLLNKCWGHQDCRDCLSVGPCSWCAVSSTCVPNTSPMKILAPIFSSNICPLWSERWELRARPLGCHVSTITFLTFLGSIYGTLLALGIILLVMKCLQPGERNQRWWKISRQYPRKFWKRKDSGVMEADDPPESRPLLE